MNSQIFNFSYFWNISNNLTEVKTIANYDNFMEELELFNKNILTKYDNYHMTVSEKIIRKLGFRILYYIKNECQCLAYFVIFKDQLNKSKYSYNINDDLYEIKNCNYDIKYDKYDYATKFTWNLERVYGKRYNVIIYPSDISDFQYDNLVKHYLI